MAPARISHPPREPPPPPCPPPLEELVDGGGGGAVCGLVTVTCIVAGAARPAPSTADTVSVVVPPWYWAAVTVSEQVRVVEPQSAGETATPAVPAAATVAGTNVLLVLVTVKWSAPVPLTVKGSADEVVDEPASMATSVRLVMVGAAKVPSAPIASTRP